MLTHITITLLKKEKFVTIITTLLLDDDYQVLKCTVHNDDNIQDQNCKPSAVGHVQELILQNIITIDKSTTTGCMTLFHSFWALVPRSSSGLASCSV